MKYFSTFSGIGGFELGIQGAFETTQERLRQESEKPVRVGATSWSDEGHEGLDGSTAVVLEHLIDSPAGQPHCVGYSEIDKYATKVYERHFPNHENYGDITKINADELPDFDCLVGGFPCQAFSIAGKRGGFDDTRGTLFFDLARILRAKQPRLFVFENVKGLLNHDSGRTFATIVQTIDELGYDCQWQVLNSKNHGVPQNRERVIIVGHLRGTPRPEVFPIGIADQVHTQSNADKEEVHHVASTQTARQYASWNGNFVGEINQLNQPKHSNDRVYGAEQGGNRQPFVQVPEATKKGYAEATVGQSINLAQPNSKTRRGRVSDIANTLDTQQQQHTLTEDAQIRRLTPLECERLQAFPDNWTKYGKDGEEISDTQRYKMCGNAVTTNVIRNVFERILAVENSDI